MAFVTRRTFARAVVGAPFLFNIVRAAKSTDARIVENSFKFQDYLYRAPYKFGGKEVDRATLLNVDCTLRNRDGKVAHGFGSMSLGNVWSFPSKTMGYDQTLGAMKALAGRIDKINGAHHEFGHPIDHNVALEPEYLKAAVDLSRELKLDEPIPKLCVLVTASAFDAAIHDAFGKLYGINAYSTYGPEFMTHDLSHYLGAEYKGEYISQYVSPKPKPHITMYHSVGASDAIIASEVKKRIGDGLPETLPEWIAYNGLIAFKIKLNGDQLDWDINRVLEIDRVVTETQEKLGTRNWAYSLDFNEKCPNVEYLLDFLARVKEKSPRGFERIQYVEQPTARDLKAHRDQDMHKAAKLRPVVIDESLIDVEALMLSREMGYSGAALKACKTQSQGMLIAAVAQKHKMFLCVQDLTCPGAAFIESAGIAAHVPPCNSVEANAREYFPVANKGWDQRFPGVFQVKNGLIDSTELNGPGMGAV